MRTKNHNLISLDTPLSRCTLTNVKSMTFYLRSQVDVVASELLTSSYRSLHAINMLTYDTLPFTYLIRVKVVLLGKYLGVLIMGISACSSSG